MFNQGEFNNAAPKQITNQAELNVCKNQNNMFLNTNCSIMNSFISDIVSNILNNIFLLNNMTTNNNLNNMSISEKLTNWILQFNVPHFRVISLLLILRSENLKVPKDVRTLLNPPQNYDIISIELGLYINLGIKCLILPVLKRNVHIL